MSSGEAPRLIPTAQPISTFVAPPTIHAEINPFADRLSANFAPLVNTLQQGQDKQRENAIAADTRDANLEAQQLPIGLLEGVAETKESDEVRKYFADRGRPELSPTFMAQLRLSAGRRWADKNDYAVKLGEIIESASDPLSDKTVEQHIADLRGRMFKFLPEQMSSQYKRGLISRVSELESRATEQIHSEISRKAEKQGQIMVSEEVRITSRGILDVLISDRSPGMKKIHVDRTMDALQMIATRARMDRVKDINSAVLEGVRQAVELASEDMDENFAGHLIDFIRDMEVVEGVRLGAGEKNAKAIDRMEQDLERKQYRNRDRGKENLTEVTRIVQSKFGRVDPNTFKSRTDVQSFVDQVAMEEGITNPDLLGSLAENLWQNVGRAQVGAVDMEAAREIMRGDGSQEWKAAQLNDLVSQNWQYSQNPEFVEMERRNGVETLPAADRAHALEQIQSNMPKREEVGNDLVAYNREISNSLSAVQQKVKGGTEFQKAVDEVIGDMDQNQVIQTLRNQSKPLAVRVGHGNPEVEAMMRQIVQDTYPKPVKDQFGETPTDVFADERAELEAQMPDRAQRAALQISNSPAFQDKIKDIRDPKLKEGLLADEVRKVLQAGTEDFIKNQRAEVHTRSLTGALISGQGKLSHTFTKGIEDRFGLKGTAGRDYRAEIYRAIRGESLSGSTELASMLRPGGPYRSVGFRKKGIIAIPEKNDTIAGGANDYSELQVRMAAVAAALNGERFTADKPDWMLVQEGVKKTGRITNLHTQKNYRTETLKLRSGTDAATEWAKHLNGKLPRDQEALKSHAKALLNMRGMTTQEVIDGRTREGIALNKVYGSGWRSEIQSQMVPMFATPGDVPDAQAMPKELLDALRLTDTDAIAAFTHFQKQVARTRLNSMQRGYSGVGEEDGEAADILRTMWDNQKTLPLGTRPKTPPPKKDDVPKISQSSVREGALTSPTQAGPRVEPTIAGEFEDDELVEFIEATLPDGKTFDGRNTLEEARRLAKEAKFQRFLQASRGKREANEPDSRAATQAALEARAANRTPPIR